MMSLFFNTMSRFGALGKCRAFSEKSFYMKLPGWLERQWEWWAWPNSQMEGLIESKVSCTGDLYPGSRESETFPSRRYSIILSCCVVGKILGKF